VSYVEEQLDQDYDDGTMHVVGHRIVSAERDGGTFTITLDNGNRVELADTDDCCAYTDLESFLLHPERVDHIITGIGTTDGYTTWHIYADMGDVLELSVGWSAGNPFYYGYAELGDTADKVADTLRAKGIKGWRRSSCACPVAKVLIAAGYPDVEVDAGWVWPESTRTDDFCVTVPKPVSNFIIRFDEGVYLDLVEVG
jgi:hypothetical protein